MKRLKSLLIIVLFSGSFLGLKGSSLYTADTTIVKKKVSRIRNTQKVQYGTASYYHQKFQGRKTSSGQLYDSNKYTCAHNGLPLNTWVKVTYLKTKRSVYVKVNDRLHHANKRVVDLSRAAATDLGFLGKGLIRVRVDVIGKKKPVGAKLKRAA